MAEAEDLKSSQCGFDPHSGHQFVQKMALLHSSATLDQITYAIGLSVLRQPITEFMTKSSVLPT
jgi:hypothetical protein